MNSKPIGTIAFILDERLSRERAHLLSTTISHLRRIAPIELLKGTTTQAGLLERLEAKHYALVLAPWYRYLAWNQIEAHFGIARTSGPTFAGYFADQLLPYELGEAADHQRAILLDFNLLRPAEQALLVESLHDDRIRSGIKPFLGESTPIHIEDWFPGPAQSQGTRLDQILALPEITGSAWAARSAAIRICVLALWSLVYEKGLGNSELLEVVKNGAPIARLEIGIDNRCLALRLRFGIKSSSPREMLAGFWPEAKQPTQPAQLLHRFADLVRVHSFPESRVTEVVALLFPSAPSEKAPGELRSFWIEPLADKCMEGSPSLGELRPDPRAIPLGEVAQPGQRENNWNAQKIKAKDQLLAQAAEKIQELRTSLEERDRLITELRLGGVGRAAPMPPTDAESLLTGFKQRFESAQNQIRELEAQLALAQSKPETTRATLRALREQIASLTEKEQEWIRMIAGILQSRTGRTASNR